jgi:hypothetical protein
MRAFALTALVLLVAGCDSASGDNVATFSADLAALNGSSLTGTAFIEANYATGVFSVEIRADGLDDRSHPQFLFARPGQRSECPTTAADTNADGVVDVVEATATTGGILLPFDNDIGGQEINVTGFPTGGTSIDYSTSAPLADVESSILRDDPDLTDPVVTLGPDGFLFFEDFVVVIHGTNSAVPATAQSVLGLDAATTLPVACGRIVNQG